MRRHATPRHVNAICEKQKCGHALAPPLKSIGLEHRLKMQLLETENRTEKRKKKSASLLLLLIHRPRQLLADLVAADHDRASRGDFQASSRPAAEETRHAFFAVDVPEEAGHGAVFGQVFGASGAVLQDGLLSCLADVEGCGEECGDAAGRGAGDEGIPQDCGVREFAAAAWAAEDGVGF